MSDETDTCELWANETWTPIDGSLIVPVPTGDRGGPAADTPRQGTRPASIDAEFDTPRRHIPSPLFTGTASNPRRIRYAIAQNPIRPRPAATQTPIRLTADSHTHPRRVRCVNVYYRLVAEGESSTPYNSLNRIS